MHDSSIFAADIVMLWSSHLLNGHACNIVIALFNDIHKALWSDSVKYMSSISFEPMIRYSWLHKYPWHVVPLCNRKNSKYALMIFMTM